MAEGVLTLAAAAAGVLTSRLHSSVSTSIPFDQVFPQVGRVDLDSFAFCYRYLRY